MLKIKMKPKIVIKLGFKFEHESGSIHTLTEYMGIFYKNNSDLYKSDQGSEWSSQYLTEQIESGKFKFLGYK